MGDDWTTRAGPGNFQDDDDDNDDNDDDDDGDDRGDRGRNKIKEHPGTRQSRPFFSFSPPPRPLPSSLVVSVWNVLALNLPPPR